MRGFYLPERKLSKRQIKKWFQCFKIYLFLSVKQDLYWQFLEILRCIECTKFHHRCERTQLVFMLIVKFKFTNLFEQRNSFSNSVCHLNLHIINGCSRDLQMHNKLQPRLSEMRKNKVERNSLHAGKVQIKLIKNRKIKLVSDKPKHLVVEDV